MTTTYATTITPLPLTLSVIRSKQFEMEVKEGLLYILNHTDGLWPRMVTTYAIPGQRQVNNFEEAMARFKAANFLDCRISAYPKYTDYYIHATGIAPTVLLVDIDKEHFTSEEFESVAVKTYTNFYDILGSRPTQLWTGGGYHYVQPQQVGVFEKSDKFSKFDEPSRRFMQFEERLLSDNMADQGHWSTVSFNNMMLRIPGSLNSSYIQFDDEGGRGKIIDIPYDAIVRIVRRWDGNTPTVGHSVLMQYYNYLQFMKISEIREQKTRERYSRRCYGRARGIEGTNLHCYDYIERLLNKPLTNFRKLCIWKIFVPYFVNVKRLPHSEAFNKTKSWLDRCNSIDRLNFNPKSKIDYALEHVGTFFPPRQDRLEDPISKPFYQRLKAEGIVS